MRPAIAAPYCNIFLLKREMAIDVHLGELNLDQYNFS